MQPVLFVFAICALGVRHFRMLDDGAESTPTIDRLLKFFIAPLFAATLIVHMMLPSSKTVAMMVVVPAISQSKAIQQDLPDIYNMAIDALKAQLTPKK